MESQLQSALIVLPTVALLLLLAGHTLAVAPGDESDDCEVPDYPVNIRVLLDSWRYLTLLPPENDDTTTNAAWTTYNERRPQEGVWIAAGGMCGDSAVAVCSRSEGSKVLLIQIIDKSLPAPDEYPVRVFVNISYSFMDCPPGPRHCDREFELQFAEMTGDQVFAVRGSDIMPDNRIRDTEIGEMQLYFDLNNNENEQFRLALVSHHNAACVSVSRVLVYRYECPDNERESVGPTRRPATQAPVTGEVSVTPQCVENSDHAEHSRPELLVCTTQGMWQNDLTECVCNDGYYRESDICKAIFQPLVIPYSVNEEQENVTVCFFPEITVNISLRIATHDVTAISNFDYVPVDKEVTFEKTLVAQCVDIELLNDELVEDDEVFRVYLLNENAILSSTAVIIRDPRPPCIEGSVTVVSDANNSSLQLVEMCSSEGVWSPVCDYDWTLQDATVICRQLGYPFLGNMKVLDAIEGFSDMIPDCSGTETNLSSCLSHIPGMSCDYILLECSTVNPTGDPQPPVITISSQGTTPVITASSTAQPTDIGRATDDSGGIPIAVIVGVGGVAVVIIVLILLALLLLVVVCVKRNKHKSVKIHRETDLCNPVYDATTEGKIISHSSNGDTHKQDVDESQTMSNPLYTIPHSTNSNGAQTTNVHYEAPEYSILSTPPTAAYETPVTSNSQAQPEEDTNQPPHVYDYASIRPTPPDAVAPDYAVLEPQGHSYHYLEGPVATPVGGGEVSKATNGVQTVGSNHQEQVLDQNNMYSKLEHK